jgi:hypothetical protein
MEEAAARQERLKALKAAQQLVEGDAGATSAAQQEAAAAEPDKPVLKFRNYTVKDEKHIQHEKVRLKLFHTQHVAVNPVACTDTAAEPPLIVACYSCVRSVAPLSATVCNGRRSCLSASLCRWRQRSRQSLQLMQR